MKQYNSTAQAVMQGIDSAPCDTWVRVWAKYLYPGKRIAKLRASVEAMRAVLNEVDERLDSVETAYEHNQTLVKAQCDRDVAQLGSMQVHDTCSDEKCMFKSGQWVKLASVPTSDAANFFIKIASVTADTILDDPVSDAINEAVG